MNRHFVIEGAAHCTASDITSERRVAELVDISISYRHWDQSTAQHSSMILRLCGTPGGEERIPAGCPKQCANFGSPS